MTHMFKNELSGSWPSGRHKAIALLKMLPTNLSIRGVSFRANEAEPIGQLEAAIRLPSGRPILLVKAPDPGPGTEVWADSENNVPEALTELLECLHLQREELSWVGS